MTDDPKTTEALDRRDRESRSMATMLQGASLASSIASTLTLAAGIIQATAVPGGQAGLGDRLTLISRVVGSPFAGLLALVAVAFLVAARQLGRPPRWNFDVSIVLLSAVSSIVVLVGGAYGAMRAVFAGSLAELSAMGSSTTSLRIATIFQYLGALAVAVGAFGLCASVWRSIGEAADDGALQDPSADAVQPSA